MELKAVQAFSYQSKSYKNGEVFLVNDEKVSDFLLKSGHVVKTDSSVAQTMRMAEKVAEAKKSK